ncbi:MAG: hypothetical protein CL885_04570 [Dehalococcoidia bacterium]|nr:hypothetical protein [Dehalococcoidia bacterium]
MTDIEFNRREEKISRVMILKERHRKLHEEADSLSSRRYLSPADQMRLKTLKVMKLRVKDAITQLESENA